MKNLLFLFFCSATVFVALFVFAGCNGNSSKAESLNPPDVSEETEDDETPEPPTESTYSVTFIADGEIISVQSYTSADSVIEEPEIPAKNGYTASWENYTLSGVDITVNAAYVPINYTISYFSDGSLLQVLVCTVENFTTLEPAVPEKFGYDGKWNYNQTDDCAFEATAEYTLANFTFNFYVDGQLFLTTIGNLESCDVFPEVPAKEHFNGKWEAPVYDGNTVEITAAYSPVEYTVTFVADDTVISKQTYTIVDNAVIEPTVPAKDHYTGKWAEYSLTGGDLTVNAVYAPVIYKVQFYADGELIGESGYTVENKTVDIPEVPFKNGYDGSWENFELNGGDKRVNAIYTPVKGTSDLTYIRNGDGWSVDVYGGSQTEIIIPSVYEGLPVTAIGDGAFSGCNIEKVTICEGVQTIGAGAFLNCAALEEISLPSSLETIGSAAFSKSSLTLVEFPENTKTISENAFYLCAELVKVVVPASVKSIESRAFAGCTNLEEVIFKGEKPELGDNVFFGTKYAQGTVLIFVRKIYL